MIQPVLWPQMSQDMDLPIAAFQHGQSANLAGLATRCALFVRLTVKYGRRSTYILSVAVMAAGCCWTAKRTTYTVILTCIIVGWAGWTSVIRSHVKSHANPSIIDFLGAWGFRSETSTTAQNLSVYTRGDMQGVGYTKPYFNKITWSWMCL
jgi:hypothetical protein